MRETLALAFQEVLTAIVRLRMKELLQTAAQQARDAGYSPADIPREFRGHRVSRRVRAQFPTAGVRGLAPQAHAGGIVRNQRRSGCVLPEAIAEALYAGGPQDPHLDFSLKPVPAEGIQGLGLEAFTWQASGADKARATVRFGSGRAVTLPGGKPLIVRYELDTRGAPLLERGYLAKAACVAEIAR